MANVPVYCLCGQPYDVTRFMIHCDVCKEWFHGSCVNLREHQSNDIENFHCPKCTKIFGPSKYKPRTNWHRHDHTEENADNKAVQTGTPVFVEELKSRHFPNADEIILRLHGSQLTTSHLSQEGFTVPILIEIKDGLGLTVPKDDLSIQDIVNLIGPNREVDVIDVGKQDNIRMTLQEFKNYLNNPNRTQILNLISLEFSNTRLSNLVEAPSIVRQISWVNTVWPDQREENVYQKPEVEKYCLIGVADCYTDFHVDFGGTSVWYHVLAGEKIFYLIRPTLANLTLYEQWMSSSNQSETFFGDQVDSCYRCTVKKGQTLLIPTGWIHAVFTPVESLVFGGNFLHDFNIALQLQIYELERRIKTPDKYRFPHFELMNWYAAKFIRDQLKNFNEKLAKPPLHLMTGVKALIAALKMWTQNKDLLKIHKPEIPDKIQHTKLIKDLNKEFRHAEKLFPGQLNDKKKRNKTTSQDSSRQANSPKKRIDPANSDPSRQWSLKLTLPKNSFQCDKTLSPLKETGSPKLLPESPFKLWLNKTTSPDGKRASDLKVKFPKVNGKARKNVKTATKKGNKSTSVKKELVVQKKDDSVYDFRDSDDDGLVVDENPKMSKNGKNFMSMGKNKKKESEKPATLKLHLSFNGKSTGKQDGDFDGDGIDVTSFTKNSGIEELLRASGYTENETKIEEDFGNGRASPSTREAIQGMLSIGCAVQFSTLTSSNSRFGNSGNSSSHQRSQRQRKFILSDDVGENMSKCHQDDEYVYPTLDASDDEIHVFKPRGRIKKDEPWNPKAKLAPNCPKPQRPVREGVRKEAVESGLAAAAAKLANLPAPKRPYYRRKSTQPKPTVEEEPEPSTSVALKRSASMDSANNKGKKPRKGMATAKQRLGKILKIHKMLH